MMRSCCLLICLLFTVVLHAQKVELLTEGTKTSIRGLSVVNDRIIWVSGSGGTVGRSIDGGATWKWNIVKGFEKREFRDIEAFDANTAIIIAVAEPGNILKTGDGGETWKVVYEDTTPGMFLDAMDFWDKKSGIVIGDPINGKFFMVTTSDAGNSWKEIPFANLPIADSGEACFAASGTNIRALGGYEISFVSGGRRSRLFWKGDPIDLPIVQGAESTGANSVAVRDSKKLNGGLHFIVVGGDFSKDTAADKNCFITTDGGKNWKAPLTPPKGYRSCVEYITQTRLITCGTSGVDVSADGGTNWQFLTKQAFHVCRKAKNGKAVFLAGGNGRIAKLVW